MIDADVVVVGSLNHDITVVAERRPAAGETVLGRSLATASGGKGANQAVAAAGAGARVAMIGCVGADAAGEGSCPGCARQAWTPTACACSTTSRPGRR